MDYSTGWASSQLPLYHPPGQLHDTYQQVPAQHHDPYQQISAVQQYDSHQNAPPHYQPASHLYGANPSQQQPSYDQSYYRSPLSLRFASSQSHYPAAGTEAETHYLHSLYASDGVPGATAADVGGFSPYPASVPGAPRSSMKAAIRQFGADPNAYGRSALHAQSGNSIGVAPQPHPMGIAGTNLLGPRRPKNAMKKKFKGPNVVDSQPAYCHVCKVECNSKEVLKSHKAGKKHKKNLENLRESISFKPTKPASSSAAPQPSKPQPAAPQPSMPQPVASVDPVSVEGSTTKTKKKKTKSENEDLETKKRKILEGGAPEEMVKTCTLCNVVCNSPIVMTSHLAGAKHKAMELKQQESGQAPQVAN